MIQYAGAVHSIIPRTPRFCIPARGECDVGERLILVAKRNQPAANNPSTRPTVLTDPHICATYCSAMRCSGSL